MPESHTRRSNKTPSTKPLPRSNLTSNASRTAASVAAGSLWLAPSRGAASTAASAAPSSRI